MAEKQGAGVLEIVTLFVVAAPPNEHETSATVVKPDADDGVRSKFMIFPELAMDIVAPDGMGGVILVIWHLLAKLHSARVHVVS